MTQLIRKNHIRYLEKNFQLLKLKQILQKLAHPPNLLLQLTNNPTTQILILRYILVIILHHITLNFDDFSNILLLVLLFYFWNLLTFLAIILNHKNWLNQTNKFFYANMLCILTFKLVKLHKIHNVITILILTFGLQNEF